MQQTFVTAPVKNPFPGIRKRNGAPKIRESRTVMNRVKDLFFVTKYVNFFILNPKKYLTDRPDFFREFFRSTGCCLLR